MSRYPWQTVSVYVNSSTLDAEELKAALSGLEPDRIRDTRSGTSYAAFDSPLPPTERAEDHLTALWDLAGRVFAVVREIQPDLVNCGISITQRMSAEDETGPGFHIESRWISALAEVGGEIDADLYVDYPEAETDIR
jgi:hypothetical protein